MQTDQITTPHINGPLTPRWFLGYPRGWVVTPDPQPTISGARTDSENHKAAWREMLADPAAADAVAYVEAIGLTSPRHKVRTARAYMAGAKGNHAQTDSSPPLCPCGARTVADGEGRKCLNCGGLEQRAREWAEGNQDISPYDEPAAIAGYLAGARAETAYIVRNTADGGGRVG